jgi:DNA-directed RNA polymerase specialized sigma24 family protein
MSFDIRHTGPVNPALAAEVEKVLPVIEGVCRHLFKCRWREFLAVAYMRGIGIVSRFDQSKASVPLKAVLVYWLCRELRREYVRDKYAPKFRCACATDLGDVDLCWIPSGEAGPDVLAENADALEYLRDAITRLHPNSREFLERWLPLDMTDAQAARTMGIPEKTFGRRKRSSLLRLTNAIHNPGKQGYFLTMTDWRRKVPA